MALSGIMADPNIQIIPHRTTLQDKGYPTRGALPTCFVPPTTEEGNFEIKPQHINLLHEFHGLKSKIPYVLVTKFQIVCATKDSSSRILQIRKNISTLPKVKETIINNF